MNATTENTERLLAWGLNPVPAEAKVAWGARTIYKLEHRDNNYFGNGNRRKHPKREVVASIDIVWDRQDAFGHEEDRRALEVWLNKKGLPALKKECVKQYVTSDSDVLITIESDGFVLKASPRESHGYLYITAYRA